MRPTGAKPVPFVATNDLLSESMGPSLLLSGSSLQQMAAKKKGILKRPPPIDKESKPEDETPNWLCATLALLLICMLLLTMVSLMSVKVKELKKKSKEQMDAMAVRVLVLSETLSQLQIGKAWKCAMCPIRWVQQGDLCFLFSDLEMSWKSSRAFCVDEFSTLAVLETKEEMDFLMHESSRYFIMSRGIRHYLQFWTGFVYKNTTSISLRDGTRVPVMPTAGAGSNPCIVLDLEKFYTKACDSVSYFICKAKIELGWS